MSTPERHNDTLTPRPQDLVRQVLSEMFPGAFVPEYAIPVVGTAEMEDQQMREFDERAHATPTEIVSKDGVPTRPNWQKRLDSLPDNPVVYETRYILDTLFRFDTTVTPSGTSTTLNLPTIPQGKSALVEEILVAQLSGAGSTPNGFLTDIGLAQLYGVVSPDGSTFGASYKSGKSVIPGGTTPMLTLQSLLANTPYLVSIQYQIRTKIEVPQFDLAELFGKKSSDVTISDDGFEASDVHANQLVDVQIFGGPYDMGGMSTGDD